jgi:hypothetical protein
MYLFNEFLWLLIRKIYNIKMILFLYFEDICQFNRNKLFFLFVYTNLIDIFK